MFRGIRSKPVSTSAASTKSGAAKAAVFVAAAVVAVVLSAAKPFSAEPARPARGSVQFGAQTAPKVAVPPAMQGFATVFADVAEKVVPTVVSVIPTKIDTVVFTNNPFYQFFDSPFFGGGNPFEEFFGGPQQRRGRPQEPQQQRQERRSQGLGSGVIVSRDGYILTNYHVVAGADEIEIKTADGRGFDASVVGADSLSDVAVVKIRENVNNLPVAYLGDSDLLRPGDWAVAIGNPFSLTSSVTMGIVSATGRQTPNPGGGAAQYQNYIQTDAAINPGNSGGALVNIRGELIGINTMIYTQTGGYMGIGFAVPINMARRIMEDLIFEGKVSRGWLGVSIQELDRATREAFGLPAETKGVLIGDVFKGQPADRAGIRRGDVVQSIDGKPTENANRLRNLVASIYPGKTVPVELLRNGKRVTVNVKLTSRDESESSAQSGGQQPGGGQGAQAREDGKFMGMTAEAVTPELRDKFGIPRGTQGVAVTQLEPGSAAAQGGIRAGDVIMEINRKAVASVKDFSQSTGGLKAGDSALLLIQRGGSTFYMVLKVRK
ncbi:MAG: Do family serine endopeptidase [Chitinispirillales bacterium]|jgi:serine protease Do|nr:Do family serine endopeptidase [Chitinispirillales bacterium]